MSLYYYDVLKAIQEYYKQKRKDRGILKWMIFTIIFFILFFIMYLWFLFEFAVHNTALKFSIPIINVDINICFFVILTFLFLFLGIGSGIIYTKKDKSKEEVREELRLKIKDLSPRSDFEDLCKNLLEEVRLEESITFEERYRNLVLLGTLFSLFVISPAIYIFSNTIFSEEEIKKFVNSDSFTSDAKLLLSLCLFLLITTFCIYLVAYNLYIKNPIFGKVPELRKVKYTVQDILYYTKD